MYEVGKREPDFKTEEKIADFFRTDLDTLRGRNGYAKNEKSRDNDSTEAFNILLRDCEFIRNQQNNEIVISGFYQGKTVIITEKEYKKIILET